MAKVQRPKGAGTSLLTVKIDGKLVEVRFDDRGEAEVDESVIDKLIELHPSLSRAKQHKKTKSEPEPPTLEPPLDPVGPVEADVPDIEENE